MNKFHSFQRNISAVELPKEIDYPHNYTPHKIAQIASEELQEYLQIQSDFIYNFGLNSSEGVGKMFGVLVVQNKRKELGYIAAFSGKLAEKTIYNYFVPPVFDTLDSGNFYITGEKRLNELTQQIEILSSNGYYLELERSYNNQNKLHEQLLETEQINIKKRRKLRKQQNAIDNQKNINEEFYLKEYEIYLNDKIASIKTEYFKKQKEITTLKQKRTQLSFEIQQKLFQNYQFLNNNYDEANLLHLFKDSTQNIPAGAGDCCAPKLFQYAYINQLTPIALAEFWWGKPLTSAIRKHKQYYPACTGKCKPILKHMLQGLPVGTNPLLATLNQTNTLNILYEDEYLLALNKPYNILSVAGKEIEHSIEYLVKKNYPKATGPLIVHRLDMSTSGILLVAKRKDIHKELQKQFINKTIQKRYVALLEEVLTKEQGTIDLPLRVDLEDRPKQMVCYNFGKKALTRWEKISIENNCTRVYFYPITGRTHQLRVHSAHPIGLNSPIIGDDLYGNKAKRLCLHAEQIKFIHPITTKEIVVHSPPPF
ncbi:tRNA pseudouridine32 synthase / 23S rRNA pseudouridine746 synthase [Tenacibaculum sp. MAR_2009_124]|uniref:RluA family pseudouridine synthase n=1 Tax=Tenacibaculum sp. MAR_2009_124 TaxID=1250059 RepID=UPI000899DB59|nr:RluA family pseudouridine synthase [Tenacibaculum sp. MAR_2009_124]SEB41525.1 tRNA pseudouridine32 synthase / 23S rRNA pseudouridine746 synthase [Tenacibaculum sp. MAR_2009_124]